MRPRGSSLPLVLLLSFSAPRALAAADSPDAQHLLPSEVSELVFVYDSLRLAARGGDVAAYREMYDPATLPRAVPDRRGRPRALGRRWLRRHAFEWPEVAAWKVADARRYGPWARLTFRHPHLTGGVPDGRWDFYFLHYRIVAGHWRLSRRAIATFGTPGAAADPPPVEDLSLLPPFALPPRPLQPPAPPAPFDATRALANAGPIPQP